jgi:hypothetical protein
MRRGGLTDSLLSLALPHADAILAEEGGDGDGLLSDCAKENGIPLLQAASTAGLADLLGGFLPDETV